MKLVLKFTLGYSLPAMALLAFLMSASELPGWSGVDPLGKWRVIPTMYMLYLAIALVAAAASRRRPLGYVVVAGIVAGIPQFIVAPQTAFLFPGWSAVGATVLAAAILVAVAVSRGGARKGGGSASDA